MMDTIVSKLLLCTFVIKTAFELMLVNDFNSNEALRFVNSPKFYRHANHFRQISELHQQISELLTLIHRLPNI